MAQRSIGSGKIFLGLGALSLAALAWGNRRVREWETLTTDDAPDGEYVTLADGTRVHYTVTGRAACEAVIMIHGWRDSAYTWRKNIPALANHFRVYALDLPGFGYSTHYGEAIYSVPQFARWVALFMDALRISRAHLVGNSLGGATALQFAYDFPERVNKLVLEDAWAYPFLEEVAWFIRWLPRFIPRGLVGLAATNRWAHQIFARNAFDDPSRVDPRGVDIAIRTSRVRGSIEALIAMAELPLAHDVWRQFDRCANETLIIWGERDLTFPLSHGERLVRELKNARLAVLPKAGHVPHAEYPEPVNKLLLDFFLQSDSMRVGQTMRVELNELVEG